MNDINEMPLKCQYCPYWEVCEYPWVCPDREQLATNLKPTCNQLATDTISRQAAIDAVKDRYYKYGRSAKVEELAWAIEALPSAQPERKPGKWIKVNGKTAINCSACYHCSWSLSFEDTVKRFNFCPNCGADMRGEQDDSISN